MAVSASGGRPALGWASCLRVGALPALGWAFHDRAALEIFILPLIWVRSPAR